MMTKKKKKMGQRKRKVGKGVEKEKDREMGEGGLEADRSETNRMPMRKSFLPCFHMSALSS